VTHKIYVIEITIEYISHLVICKSLVASATAVHTPISLLLRILDDVISINYSVGSWRLRAWSVERILLVVNCINGIQLTLTLMVRLQTNAMMLLILFWITV